MRIQKKIRQHRRDFIADYECEHCGNVDRGDGYDDAFYHRNVIPMMRCSKCKKSAPEDAPTTAPDVAAGVVL